MTKKSPETSDSTDTAPVIAENQTIDQVSAVAHSLSSENSVGMFDPTSIPLAKLPEPGDAPTEKIHRGRPPGNKTPDEKAAEKRERDARYRAKQKNGNTDSGSSENEQPVIIIPAQTYEATATVVVATVDTLLAALSEGEYYATDPIRKQYIAAWKNYLLSTGKEPPAWVVLAVMSVSYTLPAFNTPSAQTKWDKFKNRMKSWWVARFGG